ncbi:hypothetical protein KKD03_04890 [Patescibacteria group bacterium]|nr:hypothetical protein [Patescibacteria group bacterium]
MKTKYKVDCLLSSNSWGKLVDFTSNELIENFSNILFAKNLSVKDVSKIFEIIPLRVN